MLHLKNESLSLRLSKAGRKCALSFSFTLLAIEFLDEFVFGVREVSLAARA